MNRGIADLQSAALPLGYVAIGAGNEAPGNEARTRYLHLGKVALYQMSYARLFCLNTEETEVSSVFGALGRNRTNDTRIFSPLLYQLSYQGKSWWERLDSNQ